MRSGRYAGIIVILVVVVWLSSGGVQVSTGGLMVDKGQAILGDGAVVLR